MGMNQWIQFINLVGICIPTTAIKNLTLFFHTICVKRDNTELFGGSERITMFCSLFIQPLFERE